MKILHIITSLTVGGAERFLHKLLAGGLASVHDNQIICLGSSAVFGVEIEKLGVPVTYLNMQNGRPSLAAFRQLNKCIKNFSPDIIQGWMHHGNLMASIGAIFATNKPKIIWNVRQTVYDLKSERLNTRWVIRLNSFISNQPKTIIYNSKLSRAQHEDLGFKKTFGVFLPNGFDVDHWTDNSDNAAATRKILKINKDVKIISFAARYHVNKDIPTFLTSLQKILSLNNDVHCVILGRDTGPENHMLKPYYDQLPLERIHFLGQRNDMEKLLPAFTIHCLSSKKGEAFPNILGEAMACGVPCVSTNVGDSSYVLGDSGIVVPPEDPEKLALAVLDILNEAPSQYLERRQLARNRIFNKFSISKVTKSYIELYDTIYNES